LDDSFRGLYVSEDDVDRLLDSNRAASAMAAHAPSDDAITEMDLAADRDEAEGADIRIRRMARAFDLAPVDIELLIVALAPDVDPRFERLYGYLNDDVTRRRATIGLALEICGTPAAHGPARARLAPSGPLRAAGLLVVEDDDRPLLTRMLRVPDRVTAFLLGDDSPDPGLIPVLVPWVEAEVGGLDVIPRAIMAGAGLIYVQENSLSGALSFVATSLSRLGVPAVAVDMARLAASDDSAALAATAAREARLLGGGLIVANVDRLAERGPLEVRPWAEAPGLTVLIGAKGWDPRWSILPPLVVIPPSPSDEERRDLWASLIGDAMAMSPERWAGLAAYRLAPERVLGAAMVARQRAESLGRDMDVEDLQAGARSQNSTGLNRLARRLEPRVGYDDLVASDHVQRQLRGIAARARLRQRVLDEWNMAASSSRGRGVTALFAGDSGTGKTMSAEVVAGSLGLDLYVIDLSTVVDKYIGETEKNLDRIFDQAEQVNGVLLFDEADAIFGKRSEVKDARDRYANVEVAYLLQRMEQFEGIAILTTNLRANIDDAFLRRLDVLVDFPMPDPAGRRQLWERQLRPELPVADDIDVVFLADAFELSGGNIRNIVLASAFDAAAEGQPVTMAHLVQATAGEYRKLGRLCVEAEFGPYFPLITPG
ncbi:MAG TPA: ATP-binding protein, partial [Acidimicrobiales bacterium]